MSLAPGTRLGTYEVVGLLGAGGMGEVHRARDTRLGREVAIKVLPAERMADENRRRRFVQEARAASALNHPNIVTIHEIESADGIDFIVMEYVPGKSLDALIPRQGMRLADTLRIAVPIADAIACAHAAGIIHRDLKPANVVVGSDGAVKVLDFGLAKLVAHEPGSPEHETVTEDGGALSQPGTVAGTIGYMSPEQAMGQKVDARSDVFSFGALLYEMVTGRRAFSGNSTAETLSALLREQPKAPSEVVASVPKELDRLIQRCLRKEPDRRFQHMVDVKVELNEIKDESASGPAATARPARRRPRRWLAAAIVGVVILAGLAAWLWRVRPSALPPPRLVPLTSMRGYEIQPTFSPDGEQVAFVWGGERDDNDDIYLTMIGSSEIRRLTTDPSRDRRPSWSPDGRQVAFLRWSGDKATIHLVSPLGGAARKVSDFPASLGQQLSWSPDGRFLAAVRSGTESEATPGAGGIYLVPVEGSEPRLLTRARTGTSERAGAFSPDGKRFAYASCVTAIDPQPCDVHVLDLGPDLAPLGAPHRLTHQGFPINSVAWTCDGASLVYQGEGGPYLQYAWRVAARGERPPERIDLMGSRVGFLAIAPTRDRLAFTLGRDDFDFYRFVPGKASVPLSGSSSFFEELSHFSPDGRRIAFDSARSGERSEIWLSDADGSNPQQLTHGPGRWQGLSYWSPDGHQVVFDSLGEDGHWDIWAIDVGGGAPRRVTHGSADALMPSYSRDGRWVYFSSDRGRVREIWRVPAAGGVEERVTKGGTGPKSRESLDGQTLFFIRERGLVAQSLATGAERQLAKCVRSLRAFDVAADGVYYVACGVSADSALHRVDPNTGQDRVLGTLEKNSEYSIAVSPGGHVILYSKIVSEGTDLMLIENFR